MLNKLAFGILLSITTLVGTRNFAQCVPKQVQDTYKNKSYAIGKEL
jgi:hypothetical protein